MTAKLTPFPWETSEAWKELSDSMDGRLYQLWDPRLPGGCAIAHIPIHGDPPITAAHHAALDGLKALAQVRSPWVEYSQNLDDYDFVETNETSDEGHPVIRIEPKWHALTFTSWDGEPLENGLANFWREGSAV